MSRKKAPEKISNIVESFLLERGYLTICKEYEVVAKWEEIVGPRIAKVTQCQRVEDGKLYVRVLSAPWRQEMTYVKKQLLDRIKEETGCSTIQDIVFA